MNSKSFFLITIILFSFFTSIQTVIAQSVRNNEISLGYELPITKVHSEIKAALGLKYTHYIDNKTSIGLRGSVALKDYKEIYNEQKHLYHTFRYFLTGFFVGYKIPLSTNSKHTISIDYGLNFAYTYIETFLSSYTLDYKYEINSNFYLSNSFVFNHDLIDGGFPFNSYNIHVGYKF